MVMHSKVECEWIQVKGAVHNGRLFLRLSAHELKEKGAQDQAFCMIGLLIHELGLNL